MDDHDYDDLDPEDFDAEPETDDHDAVEAYAAELAEAVEAFGVEIKEPGGAGPAPQDLPEDHPGYAPIPGRGRFE
jgi:hypothetical protein